MTIRLVNKAPGAELVFEDRPDSNTAPDAAEAFRQTSEVRMKWVQ